MYTTYMGMFWGKTLWLVVCVVCGVVYVMIFLVCLHWPWDRFQCLPCLYSFISKHEGLMKGTLKHDKHLDLLHYHINVKLEKYLQSDVQVTFEFMVISHVYMSFIPNETTFTKHCLTHRELWNLLSKAVPDKFYRSDRHSKCSCLQDGANFYRSWACQIVLIFNTTLSVYSSIHMIYVPKSFTVASLALGQSYDCLSASEAILRDNGKSIHHLTTTNHNKT